MRHSAIASSSQHHVSLAQPTSTAPRVAEQANRFIKLNHMGELIAIQIYSAQLRVCRSRRLALAATLEDFLVHERRHYEIFGSLLARRGVNPAFASRILGWAGFALGFATALLGKTAIMACTAAVEMVVLEHLDLQLRRLRALGDVEAIAAIEAILSEETEHRDLGVTEGGNSLTYRIVYALVAPVTNAVIHLGLHL